MHELSSIRIISSLPAFQLASSPANPLASSPAIPTLPPLATLLLAIPHQPSASAPATFPSPLHSYSFHLK
eukprot:superscaffoldBa00000562_g5645